MNDASDMTLAVALPPCAPPEPRLLCGWCQGALEPRTAQRHTRCRHCGHRIHIPRHVRVPCARCSSIQRIRTREWAAQPLCARCGAPLIVVDLILAPRRQRRARHGRHHTSTVGGADAVWSALTIGLTIIIVLIVLAIA